MGNWVTVATYLDRSSAEIARGLLESAGIQAIVNADDMGGNRPYLGYGPGIRLTVEQKDEEEAAVLLKAVDAETVSGHGDASVPIRNGQWTRVFRLSIFGLLIPLLPNLVALFIMLKHGRAIKKEKGSKHFLLLHGYNSAMIIISAWLLFEGFS